MEQIKKKKKRKFKITTPGQSREYEKLTANRMFQAYEAVKTEDAPANATGPAIANWNPLLGDKKSPKIYKRKRPRVDLDGRSKLYKSTAKRITGRRVKAQERDTKKKFAMWGVTTNPFVKENKQMEDKKYLNTKTGSNEDAVITSLNTPADVNPNTQRPILHLPKKKYLESKDNSLEQMAINALVEKTDKVDPKELKGKLKDREDADIDNDGDVDQSDRFLHKRRKAINKKSKSKYVTGQGTKGDQDIRDRDDEEEATRSKKRPTAEALEKGVGTDEYTQYTKNLTPGEEADVATHSATAKQVSIRTKKEKLLQNRQATVIDDEYHQEDKKWIQKAIKKPGALHRDLGVPEDDKIPVSKIKAAAKGDGKVAKRARLALTLRGMNKEEVELDEIGIAQAAKMASAAAKKRAEAKRKQMAGEEVENEGWGAVAKAADSSVAKSKAKDVAAKNKKVSSWMKSRKEEALPADAKEAVVRRVKTTVVKPSLKGMPTRQRRLMKAITTSQKKREKEPKHKSGEPLIK